jgi:hypothetical protein
VLAAVFAALLVDRDPLLEDVEVVPFEVLADEPDSLDEDEDDDVSPEAFDSDLLLPDLRDSERLSVR